MQEIQRGTMTEEQEKAITQLKYALNRCAKVGLKGGVFDGSFCIYPNDTGYHHPGGDGFFEWVESIGEILQCKMDLDGGAGS